MEPRHAQETAGQARPAPSGLRILGWARTTLLDYPGKIASTIFLGGCNFRCPYCHNPELVHPPGGPDAHREDPAEILGYLARYARMLDGVCVTGGEALLQPALAALCRAVRETGLLVKLDTNGSLPGRLAPLLEEGLLDYVAVDVKGPPERIAQVARAPMPDAELAQAVEETVRRLQAAGTPFELRTTLVPGLLDADDLRRIGAWMRGAPRFVVQQFRPGKTLDPAFASLRPYPPPAVLEAVESLSPYFAECGVRGVD